MKSKGLYRLRDRSAIRLGICHRNEISKCDTNANNFDTFLRIIFAPFEPLQLKKLPLRR